MLSMAVREGFEPADLSVSCFQGKPVKPDSGTSP